MNEDKIILYHGSKEGIKGKIRPSSRLSCDFGKGFYLGNNKIQAETLVCNEEKPILYEVELNLSGLKVLKLDNCRDWYFTVAYNRKRLEDFKSEDIYKFYSAFLDGYDIVIGSIADDSIYQSLNLFFSSYLIEDALVAYLKAIDLGLQYVCKTKKACQNLRILSEKHYSKRELKDLSKVKKERVIQTKKNIDVVKSFYEGKAGITFNQIIKNFKYE